MTAELELAEEYKYARTGYVAQGRKADHVMAAVLEQLPGDGRLPLRWHHRGQPAFQKRHGHLGTVLWAPAGSSHLLLIGGQKVIRVWTDAAKHCYIDISDPVAAYLHTSALPVQEIPAGNARKCKPFTKRVRIWQKHQAMVLMEAVKRVYGLGISPVRVRMWT